MYLFIITVLVLIILFLLYIILNRTETYITVDPGYYVYQDGLIPQFWDQKLRHTRNMSYDLRGDVAPSSLMWVPFNMSPII